MGVVFIGEVRAMPFGFAPPGWMACKGQLLPIVSNKALFSLIGITYGGDGKTTFGLPELGPLAAATGILQYCIAVAGDYPGRSMMGTETAAETEPAAAGASTEPAAAGGGEGDVSSLPYLGETRIFAFGFAPSGWFGCQGSLFPVSEYQQLFQLIGTTYGGDGTNVFALPTVTGPESPDGPLNVCISLFGAPPAAAEGEGAGADACA